MRTMPWLLSVCALATGVGAFPAPSWASDAPVGVTADSPAATTAAHEPGSQPGAPPGAQRHVSPLDQRVALLARELDLDEKQKIEVREILVRQRAEVNAAWSNPAIPAATRIAASRAIGDQTAERIRAILNDQQREKYLKARPPMPSAAQSPEKLDSWISAVNAH
jgi:hypothetical protein